MPRTVVIGVVLVVALACLTRVPECGATHADVCLAPPCQACNATMSGVSLFSSLPRYTWNWERVPSNLARYDWLECGEDGEAAGHCKVASIGNEVADSGSHWLLADSEDTSPIAYFESIIVYAALAFVVAFFSACTSFCICVWRTPPVTLCSNGCCGGRYPTRYSPNKPCSCMGYRVVQGHSRMLRRSSGYGGVDGYEHLDGSADDGGTRYDLTSGGRPTAVYTPCQRWTPRIGFCVFFTLFASAVFVGELAGNRRITAGLQAVASSANEPVHLLSTGVPIVGDFVESVATNAVVPTLAALNNTLVRAVDVASVRRNLQCVAQTVDNLPRPVSLLAFVAQVNVSITDVKGTC